MLSAAWGLLLIIPLLVVTHRVNAIPIDNGVVGYPHVTCGPHSIRVDVTTEKPFYGRLFVKGESEVPGCSTDHKGGGGGYNDGPPPPEPYKGKAAAVQKDAPALDTLNDAPSSGGYGPPPPDNYGPPIPAPPPYGGGGNVISFDLPFGQCNMRRQRTLYPRGVEYTFTLVVSFHPIFITKIDRAYRVRCFYMEAEKVVNQQLEVAMLTTMQLNEQYPMPQCYYHLKRGSPDGPYVRYAKVGETVYHVWECGDKSAAYLYGMLVKNCYVDDGRGNRVQLIDEKGCAHDPHIVPNLTYDPHYLKAYTETHVFKYADLPQLYFTCTIQLCFKQDGGCDGITPPQCGYGGGGGSQSGYGQAGPYGAPMPYEPAPYGPPPYQDPPLGAVALNLDDASGPVKLINNATQTVVSTTTTTLSSPSKNNILPGQRLNSLISNESQFAQKRKVRALDSTIEPGLTKRNNSRRPVLETDITASPVMVLPFDDDPDYTQENEDDRQLLGSDPHYRKRWQSSRLAWLSRVDDGQAIGGVCLSTAGFGITVALFVSLFLLSTVLSVVLLRGHFANNKWPINHKI